MTFLKNVCVIIGAHSRVYHSHAASGWVIRLSEQAELACPPSFGRERLVRAQTEIDFIKSAPNSQHRPICLICNPLL
jgi:hypothetical protein